MFQIMWVICMFDLPTKTKRERQAYTAFKSLLMSEGLDRIQFSIYGKPMSSFEKARLFAKRIGSRVPEDGAVKFMFMTDKQMSMTISYFGGEKTEDQKTKLPDQGELF